MEKQELYGMCQTIIELNKQRYAIVKDDVFTLMRLQRKYLRMFQNRIRKTKQIE